MVLLGETSFKVVPEFVCGGFPAPIVPGISEVSRGVNKGVEGGISLIVGEGGITGIRKIDANFDLGGDGFEG